VVACHGHGDTAANFLACIRRMADAEGLAVLCPQGIEKMEDAGRIGFGWDQTPERGKAIETAIRALLKEHPEVDPKRIVWLGHSAGAWVCCADGPCRPELCKGIVLTAAPTAELTVPPKGTPPRVCLLLGTKDPNFEVFEGHVQSLKAAKGVFSANRVSDLGHASPDDAYLAGAIRWVLEGTGPSEDNTLPLTPPSATERGCRHLLVRFAGAKGAGPEVKRTEKAALAAAEKQAGLLRKEKKPAKRSERAQKEGMEEGGLLTDEAAAPFGRLVEWACWTVAPGEVRVLRSPAGFHCIWAER
jgi:predicted esterase